MIEEGPLFDAAEEAVSKDDKVLGRLFAQMMFQEEGTRQQDICIENYEIEWERLNPEGKHHAENGNARVYKKKKRRGDGEA